MGKADISSKYILAGEPVEWVRWLLQDATAQVEEHLSGEFQFILRHRDELFRVRGQQGPFVLVVEVQLHVDAQMPRWMRAYAALAEEKYDLSVYPVVFYLLPPGAGVTLPGSYHSQFMGLTAHQDFRVVPVWEMEARRVLEEGIVALVPFVPLMKGADDETIRDGVRLLQEREVGEEAEVALALFASFMMEAKQIQQIVRWDMAVLRESPWYNQILEEGLQQGVLDGRRQDIVHLLRVRFDPTSLHLAAIAEQLATIEDEERLQDLLVEAMSCRQQQVPPADRPLARLFIWAFALLALGDTGHVGFRTLAYALGDLDATFTMFGTQVGLVGIGALATAVTVTIFYVLMLAIWRTRFDKQLGWFVYLLLAAVAVRLLLMLSPANEWNNTVPLQPWSIYRNLPLMVQGLGVAYLILRDALASKDRVFTWVGVMILVSYAFYIPVIFFIQQFPLIGMLMIPKTMAYVAIAFLAYLNVKPPENHEVQYLPTV